MKITHGVKGGLNEIFVFRGGNTQVRRSEQNIFNRSPKIRGDNASPPSPWFCPPWLPYA